VAIMEFAERFEDLKIWQDARALANEIYHAMSSSRDFGFKGQKYVSPDTASVLQSRKL